jgi:PAS domain S-box-containing protein
VRRLLAAPAVFAVVFALAYLSIKTAPAGGPVAPIWLPNPAFLAIMLCASPRTWPALLIAGFLGMAVADVAVGASLARTILLPACNTFEVGAAAVLVRRHFGGAPDLAKAGDVYRFAVIIAAVSLTAAMLGTLSDLAIGRPATLAAFTAFAAGDFAGLITVTPSLFILGADPRATRALIGPRGWPMLLLAAVSLAVFVEGRYPLTFAPVAVLLLATYRLGRPGAAAGVLILMLVAVGGTLMNRGPFVLYSDDVTERILALQLFLAVCFYLSIPVASERERGRALKARLDEALAEAQAAEAKYRRIAEGVQDIIVQTDASGRIAYISPSAQALGWDPVRTLARTSVDLVHPEDVPAALAVRAHFFEGLDGPPPSPWLLRFRTGTGEYRWFEGRPKLLHDDEGRPLLESVFRDVTETLAAQWGLSDSEARYRLLAENMSDIVARYGRDGVLRYLSPSIEGVLGYTPEELVGTAVTSLLHAEDAPRVRAQFAAQREKGPPGENFRTEFRMRRKDGSLVWLEAHPKAIFDPDTGAFSEWQDVVRDISDRKALEGKLRAAMAEAEAAARSKSEFLANMSHELRTPLSSVLGFTRLATAAKGLKGPARTYVERMSEASRSLLALVNDILDFSKLEAGDLTFRPRPVDVADVAVSVLGLFEAEAAEKGVELRLENKLPEGLFLKLDPDRLRQVLINLVGNAVKFTHRGRISVGLRYDRAAATLNVDVRDTGPGIPPGSQHLLFQRFSQVDGSHARLHGGSGLGLAICKGIVEALGGSIGVTSRVGKGSCFGFWVPASPVKPPRRHRPNARSQSRFKVLVADAHSDMRELVGLFLEDVADVTAAADGAAAVRIAARQPFDVLLLDVCMPRLSGPEALRRIRAGSGPNRDTPALAFTDEPTAAASDAFLELGFAGVAVKPVSPIELISAIAHAVTMAGGAAEPEAPEPAPRRALEPLAG